MQGQKNGLDVYHKDEGCKWSRGRKCVECPFPTCLEEIFVGKKRGTAKRHFVKKFWAQQAELQEAAG
jgi:hypothetical protein